MKKCNTILTKKQLKYQHYHQVKLINQGRIIEQAKFIYSPLGKALEKQTKTIEEQERKQIDPITNQKQKISGFTQ